MSPRSRRTCHAPTWYGKIIPAAEKPTPSTALSFLATSMGGDDAWVVMRAARFPATPRPPGARLCARDKATLGAFGASEALMVCEASKGAFLCAFQCESGAGLPEPLICRESGGGFATRSRSRTGGISGWSDGAAAHGNRYAGDVRRKHRPLVQGRDDSQGTPAPPARPRSPLITVGTLFVFIPPR